MYNVHYVYMKHFRTESGEVAYMYMYVHISHMVHAATNCIWVCVTE